MFSDVYPWRIRPDGLELRLRVTPRGGRDAIDGVETLSDDRPVLKVRVRALPEDGAANDAVRKLLSKALGLPASAITIQAGATGRTKVLAVSGDSATLANRLAQLTELHQ
jgi:uncharacterized protein YggU (UPF0235/DUF167 family)